ncbi:MAG: L,D-transpeptidase family protein [Thiohalocapsa sp.]
MRIRQGLPRPPMRHGAGAGLAGLMIGLLSGVLALPASAASGTYRIYEGDSVIGTPFYVKTSAEHTLLDIGRYYGSGYDEMKQANPSVDVWVPGDNQDVLVPDFHVLPNAPREGLVMNLAEKRLYYYHSPTEVEVFSVGIGREGWETPVGTYSVIEKIKDPTWTPPASIRAEYEKRGETLPPVVPAGPDNPLGAYAMRLSNPSYLIHGTNKPWGVGMPVSSGCTRMYPEDIEALFPKVKTGTTVRIVDQPYKVGWRGDQLFLEVNLPDGQSPSNPRQVIPSRYAQADDVTLDWNEVQRTLEDNSGLPRLVGSRQGTKSWHKLESVF